MKYNPRTVFVKAFSLKQLLWEKIGIDSNIGLSYRSLDSLNINSQFLQNFPSFCCGKFFYYSPERICL